MLALRNLLAVNLRQAIHIVVVALDAEVLCQVDDFHVGWNRVLLQERLALAVAEAEEHHIDLVKRHFCREALLGFPEQPLMHIAEEIPRV